MDARTELGTSAESARTGSPLGDRSDTAESVSFDTGSTAAGAYEEKLLREECMGDPASGVVVRGRAYDVWRLLGSVAEIQQQMPVMRVTKLDRLGHSVK
jgi:hypothetical protein